MHRQLNKILSFVCKLVFLSLLLKKKPFVWIKVLSLLNASTQLVFLGFYIESTSFSPYLYLSTFFPPSPHHSLQSSLVVEKSTLFNHFIISLTYLTLSSGPCSSNGHTNLCSGCSELISIHSLNSFVSSRINSYPKSHLPRIR